jgi:hypothetical protein
MLVVRRIQQQAINTPQKAEGNRRDLQTGEGQECEKKISQQCKDLMARQSE